MIKIDEKCETLKKCIVTMSQKVSQMYEEALDATENNDSVKALKVIRMDEFVNHAEEDIDDLAIEALALLAPVASDLRLVVAGIKITTDLERIGDYAKAIASFVIENGPLEEELKVKVRQMGDALLAMLDHATDAYVKSDAVWAMNIPLEDDRIDEIYKESLTLLEKEVNPEVLGKLVPTVAMMRNLERAGDHVKNICEDIIYQVKGQQIEFN